MIHYVSNQKNIVDSSIEYCSVEESLEYLNELDWVSCDTETQGLDRFIHKILLLQLGDKERQYVIDVTTVDIQLYKSILEEKNLILQGAKFDIQFFYVLNIIPTGRIWDTMLAEQVLYNGYNPIANLEYLGNKYYKVKLNKSHGINFTRSNYIVNIADIIYAAEDIEYLSGIKDKQTTKAINKGVLRAIDLENTFVRVLAYIEYSGIYLDEEAWNKKVNEAKELLEIKIDALNDYVINNNLTKYIDQQLDLFSTKRKTIINWSSSKQVIPLFEDLGINVTVDDNKSGKSIAEKVIKRQQYAFPIIKLYLEYQTIKKDFTTYGTKFLEHIHPVTGRIHSEFNQIQVTTRLSSSKPNLQNLPADERTRSCFVAEEGNILVDCDYGAQEDKVFVNNALEAKMIEFYKMPNADGHSYVASLCFPNEIGDTPLHEIKKKFPKLRQLAKAAKFALHYGGTGYTIAKNLGLSEEEGNKIADAYLTAFPGIDKYLKRTIKLAETRKFILTSRITGRKYWANEYDEMSWKEQKEFAKLGNNYPIQTESAELTKIGLIYFFQWILDNNYFNIVLIPNAVHDEALTESPIKLTDIIANNLKECLEKGAEPYCKIVPLKTDVEISNYWVH